MSAPGTKSSADAATSATPSAGHTPGPWLPKMQFGEWYVRQDPSPWDGRGYQLICNLPAEKKSTPLGEMYAANARLIAAAPDLLEAARLGLQEAESLIRSDYEGTGHFAPMMADLEPIRAAIQRATGAA